MEILFDGVKKEKRKNRFMKININNMPLVGDMKEDKAFFKLAKEAEFFLESHSWCKKVVNQWFSAGWEEMVLVFFFEIIPNSHAADNFVWIVVGDIPPCYIDIESAQNSNEVIQVYVEIMEDWINCVNNGESVENCYPVEAPPEKKYADMLSRRIQFIKDYIIS